MRFDQIIGMQMSTAFRSNSEKAALGHDSVSGQHAPGPNLCQSSPQKSESLLMGAFTVYDCGIRGICSNWNLYHGFKWSMVCRHLFVGVVPLDSDPDSVVDFDLFWLLLLSDFTFIVVFSVFLLCVLQHSFDGYLVLWEAFFVSQASPPRPQSHSHNTGF